MNAPQLESIAVSANSAGHNGHLSSNGVDFSPDCCPQRIPVRFMEVIPREFARRHLIIGQHDPQQDDRLSVMDVVVASSTNPAALHNTGVLLEVILNASVADGEAIARAIDEAYTSAMRTNDATGGDSVDAASFTSGAGEIEQLLKDADCDLLSTEGNPRKGVAVGITTMPEVLRVVQGAGE